MTLTPSIILRVIDSAQDLTPAQIRALAEAVAEAVAASSSAAESSEGGSPAGEGTAGEGPAGETPRDLAAWASGIVLDSDRGNLDALEAAEAWARRECHRASASQRPEDAEPGHRAAAFLAALEAFRQAVVGDA